MTLPPEALQHTLTIEAYLGTDGYGVDLFAAPVGYPGLVEQQRKIILVSNTETGTGDEVVSSTTAYINRGATVPPNSRATLPDGSISTVIAVFDRDGGALPVPSHLEIVIA